jgi:hypothetical protein
MKGLLALVTRALIARTRTVRTPATPGSPGQHRRGVAVEQPPPRRHALRLPGHRRGILPPQAAARNSAADRTTTKQ